MKASISNINKNRKDISFLYVDKIDEESEKASHQQFFDVIVPAYEEVYLVLLGERKEGTATADNFFAKIVGIEEFRKNLELALDGSIEDNSSLDYHCTRKTICDWFKKEKEGRFIFTPQVLASFIGHLVVYMHNSSYRSTFKENLGFNCDLIVVKDDAKPIFENILNHIRVDLEKLKEFKKNSTAASQERKQFNAYIETLCNIFGVRQGLKTGLKVNEDWLFFQKDSEGLDIGLNNKTEGSDIVKLNNSIHLLSDANSYDSNIGSVDLIENYYTTQLVKFREISTNSPKFSFATENLIKPSIRIVDKGKNEMLNHLILKRDKLWIDGEYGEELNNIRKKIKDLNGHLNSLISVSSLIDEGANFCISGDKSIGKTTILKWIIVQICNREIGSDSFAIPIYIIPELHESFGSIENILNHFNEKLKLVDISKPYFRYILFIDDFNDEYAFKKIKKEITDLKFRENIQIVFSARENFPILNFKCYKIDQYGLDEMSVFAEHELSESTGGRLISLINRKGVLHEFKKPLNFLSLLSYVEGYDSDLLWANLESFISNKGLLYQEVFIHQLVYGSEINQNASISKKERLRNNIELLSKIAYLIGALREPGEFSFSIRDIISIFHDQKETPERNSDELTEAFESFVDYGLLEYSTVNSFSFTSNEMFYYFYARYVNTRIKSFEDYTKIKLEILGGIFTWVSAKYPSYIEEEDDNVTFWNKLRPFLFGLVDPDIVCEKKRYNTDEMKLVISKKFLEYFDENVEFISLGNTSNNLNFSSKSQVINFILNLSELPPNQYDYFKFKKAYIYICKRLVLRSHFFHYTCSKRLIDKINRFILDSYIYPNERAKYFLFSKLFRRYRLSDIYGDYVKIIDNLRNNYFDYSREIPIAYAMKDYITELQIDNSELENLFINYTLNRKEGLLLIERNTIHSSVEKLLNHHRYRIYEIILTNYSSYTKEEILQCLSITFGYVYQLNLEYSNMSEEFKTLCRNFFSDAIYSKEDYFESDDIVVLTNFLKERFNREAEGDIVLSLVNELENLDFTSCTFNRLNQFYLSRRHENITNERQIVEKLTSILPKCDNYPDIESIILEMILYSFSYNGSEEFKKQTFDALLPYFKHSENSNSINVILRCFNQWKITPTKEYIDYVYFLSQSIEQYNDQIIEFYGRTKIAEGETFLKSMLERDEYKDHAIYSLFHLNYAFYNMYIKGFKTSISILNFFLKKRLELSSFNLEENISHLIKAYQIGNDTTLKLLIQLKDKHATKNTLQYFQESIVKLRWKLNKLKELK